MGVTSSRTAARALPALLPAARVRAVTSRTAVASLAALTLAVAIGGGVAVLLGRGSGTGYVGVRVALFNRTTYSNSTSASDASRFQELALGATASPSLIDSIQAADPHTKVML